MLCAPLAGGVGDASGSDLRCLRLILCGGYICTSCYRINWRRGKDVRAAAADSSNDDNRGRPETCLDCGQTFQQVSAKNRHMRTHSGVKPYKCFYCEYATDRKESLKNHCIKRHEMTKEEFKGRADIVFS